MSAMRFRPKNTASTSRFAATTFPLADGAGPRAQRVDGVGRGGARHRTGGSLHLRDLPDDAVSPVPSSPSRPPRCRSCPTGGSPSAWAAARTSTSTSSARAGPPSNAARTCCAKPSRSSASCSAANWSTGAAITSRWTPPVSGTCPTSRPASRWRSAGRRPSTGSSSSPTTSSRSSPTRNWSMRGTPPARSPTAPMPAEWSGRYRCRGIPTATPPSNARTTSSAGSPAAGGQRRPADAGRFRGGDPVRAARRRRREHPLRPGSGRHRRRDPTVLGGRFHRCGAGPDRWGHAGEVPQGGRRASA